MGKMATAAVAFAMAAMAWGDEVKTTSAYMEDVRARTLLFTGVADIFRCHAASNTASAVSAMFSDSAKSAWNASVASEIGEMQLGDFFTGAVEFSGHSVSSGESIVGLYNPWWDAILVMRIRLRDETVSICEWHFLSGETFRGESVAGDVPRTLTVVPDKDPLAVEIWRVLSGTRRRFVELFPVEGARASWGRFASTLLSVDRRVEMERIQVRSGLRLRLRVALMQNAHDGGMAELVKPIVRKASLFQLYRHFRKLGPRKLLEPFSKLPSQIRNGFDVYGYVGTKDNVLYVYVNKAFPRYFVTVSIVRDNTEPLTSSLEWYDLMQADDLLDVWNSRNEEVSK